MAAGSDKLSLLVEDGIKEVNAAILERMQSEVVLIPQLAGHIIAAGGKRLRPMLTLATAQLCGYGGKRQIKLAACIEFIHTATLLHDDVVDESDLRRGQASANALFGNKPSVLVGDFLFSRAFELMVEDGSLEVLATLSRASAVLAEGEVMQLLTSNDTSTTEEKYLEVIRSKTAQLFAAACRIGGIVADKDEEEKARIESFGLNLGMAFQLIDDVLDYSANQAKLGKTIGDDFREGKITLPVVIAFALGNEEEKAFWRRTMEDQEQEDGDLETAQSLFQKHGALDKTVAKAREYAQTAKAALEIFPPSSIKEALLEVVDFCVERSY